MSPCHSTGYVGAMTLLSCDIINMWIVLTVNS